MAYKTYTNEVQLASGFKLKIMLTEDYVGTSAENKSTCVASLWLIVNQQAQVNASYATYSISGDTSASGGGGSFNYGSGEHLLLAKEYTKNHNNDGTATSTISGNLYVPAVGWNQNISVSGALTPIARYADITSFTVSQKDETSLTFNWKTSSTIDYLWYSTNDGSTWTAYDTPDGTSGGFDVTGLSAGTSYNCKIKVRRKDNQLVGNPSSRVQKSTYSYPYVNTVENNPLKIGESQTLTLYNPLGRTTNVYMKQNDTSGTTLYSGSTSTTTIQFTPNASTLNNSIPNSPSGNAVYYCDYSGHTTTAKSGTYEIDNSSGTYDPDFDNTNWSYSANYTSLTNDNQIVISGKSTITFSVDTSATPKNGASISSYKVEWGTQSDIISGSTGTASLTGDTSNILKITVVDSRGYTKESTLNIADSLIDYQSLTTTGNVERNNGVEANTFLTLEGTMFNNKFGEDGIQNSITSIKYYTSSDGQTWSNAFTISTSGIITSENNYSLNNAPIHLDGTSGGFPIGSRYYVKAEIEDNLSTTMTQVLIISDGKLAIDCFQDSNGDYHRGVNGLADSNYALEVHGDVHTTGNFVGNFDGTIDNATKWNNLENDANTVNTTDTWIPVFTSGKMQHTLRAIWSAKQHSDYNNNQEYLATLSTLSFWNGAYNSSNGSNLTYAHQGTIQCKPTQLYNNTSGATGTITLSETSANYNYIDVHYFIKANNGPYSGNIYGCTRVYAPNGKVINLNVNWIYDSTTGATQTVTKQILISTNKITNKSYSAFNVGNNISTWSSYSNSIYITRVDGWK